MKRWGRKILTVALILSGLGLLLYPNIQMLVSAMNQTVAVTKYEKELRQYDEERKQKELLRAEEYNRKLLNTSIQDPFGGGESPTVSENYEEILNVDMGMMGTLEIPCINVELPVYHGIGEEVLRKGAGHLPQTAFPIGGKGNHTVLSAHRGLPEARLFTDLDRIEEGDEFYIRILDETLAYRVDQIKVVEPGDTEDLQPVSGEDHVTLLTCTPYGINSHRLLVRGIRTAYEEEAKASAAKKIVYAEQYILAGAFLVILFGILIRLCRRRKKEEESI